MAPAFCAPERAQSAFASSRFDSVTFRSAISDSLDDGSRETFALLVAGLPLSGEEVAYGTADLAIDIAEAVLLLRCLGFVPHRRQHFSKFYEQFVRGWPFGQSFA